MSWRNVEFLTKQYDDAQCVDVKKGTTIDFEMEVMKGGDLKLSYRIKSPSGAIIAEELEATSVEKDIEAPEDGTYDFCFDNSNSMVTEKVVYFDLGVYDENQDMYNELEGKLKADNETDKETYTEIVRVTELIRKRIDTVSNYQGIYRAQTGRHQYLIESNMARVTWFSFASCFIMIAVGVLQVILVRNLFAEKRR
eukprot:gene16607-18293_t